MSDKLPKQRNRYGLKIAPSVPFASKPTHKTYLRTKRAKMGPKR